ncbi:MAG: SufD family Fe-S cluster assembly protein [Johnsonella sp.]|nr:SufD family Fe-S cluster assembly protein [Johnsonella sp.]
MKMILNKLPSITWSWLQMNEAKLKTQPELLRESEAKLEIPEGLKYEKAQEFLSHALNGGAGEEFDAFLENAAFPVHRFVLEGRQSPKEALRIEIAYEEEECSAKRIEILVKESANLKVIMHYSNAGSRGFGAVQTKIRLEKNAKLHLIQVQKTREDFVFINDIAGVDREDSFFELTKIVLGAKESYEGFLINLEGDRSAFHTDVAYLVEKDYSLDMNYVVKHFAPDTVSDIEVRGVLRDQAYKLFRGTIDILRGAVHASGKENEEVLLIDDEVVNKSIPVILCGEEDVEGAHGATIGRLDEDLLFYMQTRGISEEEIYEIMAKARIREVSQKIEDKRMLERILDYIGGEEDEA